MGVRTAERITGVSMEGVCSDSIISDAGGRRFAAKKQRHNAEATEGRTRRTQRRRRDNAETQSEQRTAEKREGTTWLCPPRLQRVCVSSWRRQRSLGFRRRWGRKGLGRRYPASGSRRRAGHDGESDGSSPCREYKLCAAW